MDEKWVLTVNEIVCSFCMFLLTSAKGDGVASLELDDDDDDDDDDSAPADDEDVVCAESGAESDSLGGWFVTVSVVVSSAGLAANNPFSLPVSVSSLTSPYAMASDTDTKPDSESVTVALTTGSTTPSSVKFAIASATPTISASSIRWGRPLENRSASGFLQKRRPTASRSCNQD